MLVRRERVRGHRHRLHAPARDALVSCRREPHIHIGGVTPDGATLVISEIRQQHVHLASINVADGKRTPLLTTPFTNTTPALSPDGKWLAYASDESGSAEIYVQAFPSMQGRTQVSAGGGSEPVWSRTGAAMVEMLAS